MQTNRDPSMHRLISPNSSGSRQPCPRESPPGEWRTSSALLALAFLPVHLFAQGDLNPPGPPAPTMKSLDQVEARTPITSVPFTIDQPGSYYLAGNFFSATTAILITTNNVTLDLRGFTLTGTAGAGNNHFGIHISGSAASPRKAVVVRNGVISGFYNGVEMADAVHCVIEGLSIQAPLSRGINLRCSPSGVFSGNVVRNVTIAQTPANGILFLGAAGARCRNNLLEGCVLSQTADTAIQFNDSSGEVAGNRILRCVISSGGGTGISFVSSAGGTCSGNRIEDCSITAAGTFGIILSAGAGACNGNTIRGCTLSGTGLAGILLTTTSGACSGNLIEECTLSRLGTHGVHLSDQAQCAGNVIRRNEVRTAVGRGIFLDGAEDNRIEFNHLFAAAAVSSYGISTTNSARNMILGNSCIGHAFNFSISTNDTYGPIVSTVGVLATSGDPAHPAANFSR